ncbi:MAG: hypothetical protein ACYDEP_02505 [Acidimicrobiales bacterium]
MTNFRSVCGDCGVKGEIGEVPNEVQLFSSTVWVDAFRAVGDIVCGDCEKKRALIVRFVSEMVERNNVIDPDDVGRVLASLDGEALKVLDSMRLEAHSFRDALREPEK